MPQEVHRQANFTGGEIGPRFLGRRDLRAYASSLALCENMLPLPQGPIIRRPGLAHVDMIRNRLEAVPTHTVSVAAPNGGDGEGLMAGAGFATTTALGTTDGYVIAEFDFGGLLLVGMVDLIDFAIVAAGGGTANPAPPQFPWWGDDQLGVIP